VIGLPSMVPVAPSTGRACPQSADCQGHARERGASLVFLLELLQDAIGYGYPSGLRLVENRVTSVQPVAGPDRIGAASLAIALHDNHPETARARCDGA
jgi:hypothetical protein